MPLRSDEEEEEAVVKENRRLLKGQRLTRVAVHVSSLLDESKTRSTDVKVNG